MGVRIPPRVPYTCLMPRDDELDGFKVSSSSSEYFTRTTETGRQKADLRRNVEEKTVKIDTGKDLVKLDTDRQLSDLGTEVDGQKDEEQKRQEQENEEKQSETFGTKKLKQQEDADREGAGTKESPDRLVEQEEREEQAEAASDQEYQAQMG